MPATALGTLNSLRDEERLVAFGLSTTLIHTALRPGASRASNRTSLALKSARGTDIYQDSMEMFHQLLADAGWDLVYVENQPRLFHPQNLLAFTITSGTWVAQLDPNVQPRTRKGKATRGSLVGPRVQVEALFDLPDGARAKQPATAMPGSPLWLLVHERTDRGLNLELSRPGTMNASGRVTEWADLIMVGFLDLDGDLSVFEQHDDGGFDVAVEPI